MQYKVQFDYVSSLGGPWKKGEILTLDESLVEDLNRDCPGVLKRHVKRGKNRQVRKPRATRAMEESR